MQHSIKDLERRIEAIKARIATLGDLQPGSLSVQYNVCGNPRCKCKATPPQKHGPYYQLSFTRKGKSGTRFVRQEDVAEVRAHLKNYGALRLLVDRWIAYATELANARLAAKRE